MGELVKQRGFFLPSLSDEQDDRDKLESIIIDWIMECGILRVHKWDVRDPLDVAFIDRLILIARQ